MKILNLFREARLKSGYSRQEDVAQILGIDRSSIAKWETGKSRPKQDTLFKLLELYHCKFEDLYSNSEKVAL